MAIYLLVVFSNSPDTDYQSDAHAVDPRFHWIPTFLGSGLAIMGALSGRPWLLVLAFAVGFFWNFLGLYLLNFIPRIPSLIPIGEIGYLVSAVLLRRAQPR